MPVQLDVTDQDQAQEAIRQAAEHFGQIDVLVNNAGYRLCGAVEEISDVEVRALLDTNVFGLLDVVRAALPTLRAQGAGASSTSAGPVLALATEVAGYRAVSVYDGSWAEWGLPSSQPEATGRRSHRVPLWSARRSVDHAWVHSKYRASDRGDERWLTPKPTSI